MGERASIGGRYARWWLHGLPPMHGLLRFVFYVGLLVLAFIHWKSPITGFGLYEMTSPVVYESYGLLDLLGVGYVDPAIVRVIVNVMIVAWVATAIGLFTPVSSTVTGLTFAFLHGLFWHSNVFNHSWIMPLWILLALMGIRANDNWSVDAHLRRLWRRWRRIDTPREHPVAASGFPRMLVLIVVVAFYTAAGVTKLQNAGLQWTDGHTIQYFLSSKDESRTITHWFGDRMWLCNILAWASLAIEVLSPLALLSRWTRWFFVLGWFGLHLGIRITLGPWYLANMLCMVLLIEWRWLALALKDVIARRFGRVVPRAVPPAPAALRPSQRVAIGGGTALLGIAAMMVVFQILWWPLTNVYMYSTYYSRPDRIRAGYPRDAYRDPVEAQRIARSFLEDPPAFDGLEYLPSRVRMYVVRPNGDRRRIVDRGLGVSREKQWRLAVVLPVIIADLAGKPDGKLAYDPARPDTPATELLRRVAPLIRAWLRMPERYEAVQMTYRLDGTEVTIAQAPLNPPDPPALRRAPSR